MRLKEATPRKEVLPTMATTAKNKKLRHNEYYGQQRTLDELYEQSLKGARFKKIYEKTIDESSNFLAYRNIKTNTGISDQWEFFETTYLFAINDNKLNAIRNGSKLKECYIIRYADDFKIMCRTRDVAERTFIAVKAWLKERIHLEISPNKSQITNLRKKASEFLGFSIKAVVKGKKRIARSNIKSEYIYINLT